MAINPANNAVIPPNKIKSINTFSLYSKIIEHLTIINTPAVTIVAACNNEDTGVGFLFNINKIILSIFSLNLFKGRTISLMTINFFRS